MLMNRLIPGLLKDRDWDRLKGLRDAGDAVVLIAGFASAAFLVVLAFLFPRLGLGFLLGAALLIPFGFGLLRRQQLAAMRRSAWGLMMDQGFGATIAVAVLLTFGIGSMTEATLLFGGAVLLGIDGRNGDVPAPAARRAGRRHPAHRFSAADGHGAADAGRHVVQAADEQDRRADAGPLSDMHQTGLYGAAFRLTYVLTFPQVVMVGVVTPLLSEAFTHGRMGQARRLVRGALLLHSPRRYRSRFRWCCFPSR